MVVMVDAEKYVLNYGMDTAGLQAGARCRINVWSQHPDFAVSCGMIKNAWKKDRKRYLFHDDRWGGAQVLASGWIRSNNDDLLKKG